MQSKPSMEHSPTCKDENQSDGQYVLCILWNLKVHYHVQKSPSLVFVLSLLHPVYIIICNHFKINSYTTLQPILISCICLT